MGFSVNDHIQIYNFSFLCVASYVFFVVDELSTIGDLSLDLTLLHAHTQSSNYFMIKNVSELRKGIFMGTLVSAS